MDYTYFIPDEVLLHLFSYIQDHITLCHIACVCKRYGLIIGDYVVSKVSCFACVVRNCVVLCDIAWCCAVLCGVVWCFVALCVVLCCSVLCCVACYVV